MACTYSCVLPRLLSGYNAFFYSLVSRDTKEMLYSSKRQRFLVDQGYSFKVITELTDIANIADLKFSTKQSQLELLARVLATEDAAGEEEFAEGDPFAQHQKSKNAKLAASRRRGNAQALSGSNDRAYHEYEERRETAKSVQKSRHSLFRARQQQAKDDAKNR
jgi:DNA excision repair protein ERCC-3